MRISRKFLTTFIGITLNVLHLARQWQQFNLMYDFSVRDFGLLLLSLSLSLSSIFFLSLSFSSSLRCVSLLLLLSFLLSPPAVVDSPADSSPFSSPVSPLFLSWSSSAFDVDDDDDDDDFFLSLSSLFFESSSFLSDLDDLRSDLRVPPTSLRLRNELNLI